MAKKIIIVGASSGIGKAIAELELQNGSTVALLARREKALESIAKGANKGKDKRAHVIGFDVTKYSTSPKVFQKAVSLLGGVDEVYYASGVMPAIEPNEYNTTKDLEMIDVNLSGAIAFLNPVAKYFESQKFGKIIGISSIAGERGRKGNPVYNTSKAGLNTYLEALRNRLAEFNVQVTTIKPGFVITEMTKDLNLPKKGLLKAISAEDAAYRIIQIVEKKKEEVFVPGIWGLVGLVIRNIPNFIFKKMSI